MILADDKRIFMPFQDTRVTIIHDIIASSNNGEEHGGDPREVQLQDDTSFPDLCSFRAQKKRISDEFCAAFYS